MYTRKLWSTIKLITSAVKISETVEKYKSNFLENIVQHSVKRDLRLSLCVCINLLEYLSRLF